MKAPIYLAVGKKALDGRPQPEIAASTDAIVKITKTTIYGTDVPIVKSNLSRCKPGRVFGHERVGIVETVGAAVTMFKPGDNVMISCASVAVNASGAASGCIRLQERQMDSRQLRRRHAGGVRWFPRADTNLYPMLARADQEARSC